MELRPSRLVRAGDALSQLANVLLLNGDANESISGRAHRQGCSTWTAENGRRPIARGVKVRAV